MSDESKSNDPGALWRSQPVETMEIDLAEFVGGRTRDLYSRTRSEILMSIAAAVFFMAVIAWRLALPQDRLSQIGAALAIAWVLISLYWFRDRIRRGPAPSHAVAVSCLEYYRKELERRRDHLRNAWLWQGPLLLACMILAMIVAGKEFITFQPLRSVAPFVILLAVWTGIGILSRRREARELQREMDEIGR